MTIYDISRGLAPDLAVWPGDAPFQRRWQARLDAGSVVNLGGFSLSTHAGTHVDAPLHVQGQGASVDQLALWHFVGPAEVVEVEASPFILPGHLDATDLGAARRVLFKTRHSQVPDAVWDPDWAALHPDTVELLGRHGVCLVGTDAPSVDPYDSKALTAHHALVRHGIVNLENLMLRDVPPGRYRIIALPLKLQGLDAAPLRAVLLSP